MAFRDYIGTLEGSLVVVLVCAALIAMVCELTNVVVMRVVAKKSWWPSAEQLQKHLLVNFGFAEDECTPEVNLEAFAFIILGSAEHTVMSLSMLPVVLLGWSEAGPTCQLLFLMAVLAHMGYEIYDWIKITLKTFLSSTFKSLGAAPSLAFWVIQCVLHHPLTLIFVIPMNLKYSYLPEYHRIACALLMAAGVGLGSGQYKFTLNVRDRHEYFQYKTIVLFQFSAIWFARCFVWFPSAYSLLKLFHDQNDTPYFVGGLIGVVTMSLFNTVMLLDSTTAAMKWLPRPFDAEDNGHGDPKHKTAHQNGHAVVPSSPTSAERPRLLGGHPKAESAAESKEPMLGDQQQAA